MDRQWAEGFDSAQLIVAICQVQGNKVLYNDMICYTVLDVQ